MYKEIIQTKTDAHVRTNETIGIAILLFVIIGIKIAANSNKKMITTSILYILERVLSFPLTTRDNNHKQSAIYTSGEETSRIAGILFFANGHMAANRISKKDNTKMI